MLKQLIYKKNDPFADKVILSLSGKRGFVDESRYEKQLTPTGNVISTPNVSKFGTSLYFNGSSFLTTPQGGSITGDYTIEAWVLFSGFAGTSGYSLIVGSVTTDFTWWFGVGGSVSGINTVYFLGSLGNFGISVSFDFNRWYHLTVSKSDTTTRFFVDGKISYTWGNTTLDNGNLSIGGRNNAPYYNWFLGNIEGLKITQFCRYTQDFTPSKRTFRS